MNKEIYTRNINMKITEMIIEEGGVVFVIINGDKITLRDYHEQDCCERVYADWSILETQIQNIVGKTFEKMVIKTVEKAGFLICLYEDRDMGVKIFVPCYNDQNGYYSSELELIIDGNIKINISDSVEDHID